MAITYVQTTYNVNLYQVLHKRLSDLNAGNAPAPPANAGGDQGAAAGPAGVPAAAPLPDIAAQPVAQAQGQAQPAGEKDAFAYDAGWVDTKMKKAALKLEKLDSDLKNYKSNSIKESIRRGHDDLADHYLSVVTSPML